VASVERVSEGRICPRRRSTQVRSSFLARSSRSPSRIVRALSPYQVGGTVYGQLKVRIVSLEGGRDQQDRLSRRAEIPMQSGLPVRVGELQVRLLLIDRGVAKGRLEPSSGNGLIARAWPVRELSTSLRLRAMSTIARWSHVRRAAPLPSARAHSVDDARIRSGWPSGQTA
jgi:hypothetical protein